MNTKLAKMINEYGEEGCVEMIEKYVKTKEAYKKYGKNYRDKIVAAKAYAAKHGFKWEK